VKEKSYKYKTTICCLNCKKSFTGKIKKKFKEDEFPFPIQDEMTTIYTCPRCNSNWRTSKHSGIDWTTHSQHKKILEKYSSK
jgi:hypothetical protein